MRLLVKELERLDCIVHHGAWDFIADMSTHKQSILFDKQEVISMEEMEDVILIMVCLEASNLIEKILCSDGPLPCLFKDHTLKYETI